MTKTTTAVEKAEHALTEAQNTIQERRKALQRAVTRVDTIKSAWARGDDSIGASEKVEAEAEASRIEVLIPAAERAVKAAERKLNTLTPVLAEKVADALDDHIFGAQAEVVTTAPAKGSNSPKVYVVEAGERRATGQSLFYQDQGDIAVSGGAITGDVEIIVTGPDYMAPFDSTDVLHFLRSRGVLTGGNGALRGPVVQERGKGVFVARFRIDKALPLMPVIPTFSPNCVRDLEGIDQHFKRVMYSPVYDADQVASFSKAELVTENVGGDGIRRVTVDVSLYVRPINGADGRRVQQEAEKFMTALYPSHKGIQHLGTINEARVTSEGHIFDLPRPGGDTRPVSGVKVTARLVFVSKPANV